MRLKDQVAIGTEAGLFQGADLKTGTSYLARTALGADIVPNPNKPSPHYPRERLREVGDSMRDTVKALRQAIEPIETAKRAKASELAAKHIESGKLLE